MTDTTLLHVATRAIKLGLLLGVLVSLAAVWIWG